MPTLPALPVAPQLPSADGPPVVAPDAAGLLRAAALLKSDQVCAFPTETVYGLGASALSTTAVERIYALKGRPKYNPLIVHVASAEAAEALAGAWPASAARLAAALWPGPLTMVVPRGPRIPAMVSAGRDTVALRVPAHPVALALLQACGLPLAAPSANRSESVSPTTAQHVARSLPAVPLILDGGPCQLGIESTVVDLTCSPPRLLRPGALPVRALRALLPDLEVPSLAASLGPEPAASSQEEDTTARAAPGMMSRHYAPRAVLYLLPEAALQAKLSSLVAAASPAGHRRLGLLCYRSQPDLALHCAHVEQLPDDPLGYAADLYAALHRLDDAGVDVILAVRPPDTRAEDADWLAITDRLQRAAAKV